MNIISKDVLAELISFRKSSCVSIFMPTFRSGKETEQNPIRFKNLIREAEQRLVETGRRGPEARELLKPAQSLLLNSNFWRHQGDGLSVFLADDFFRCYPLPMSVDPQAVVSDHFHITPLLPLFMQDGRFFALTVNKKHIRLFECTRLTMRPIELTDVPTHIQDYLKYSANEEQLRFHSLAVPGGGAGTVIFHGQGIGTDAAIRKKEVFEFLQFVDRNLRKKLNGDRIPMVLVGVEYERTLFRAASSYPAIFAEGVDGSPETMTEQEIHARTWSVVEPHFKKSIAEARQQFFQGINSARASQSLTTIVPAAVEGRVEILFVTRGLTTWGRFDAQSRAVEVHSPPRPGDENLQDLAAIHTLSTGGAVYVLDSRDAPVHEPLAATFRY